MFLPEWENGSLIRGKPWLEKGKKHMIRYNDHWMLKAGSMIMILGILGCASEKTNYTSALNVSTAMGKEGSC